MLIRGKGGKRSENLITALVYLAAYLQDLTQEVFTEIERRDAHKLRLHFILESFNLLRQWRPALTPTSCQRCVDSGTNCRRAAAFHLRLARRLSSPVSLKIGSHLPVNPVQITSLCHCSSATSVGGKHTNEGGGGAVRYKRLRNE